jgi:biotin carboxyl carrier protein
MADDAANEKEGARAIDRVADQLLPALIARLSASELGELEVAERGWRIRLRKDPAAVRAGGGKAATPGHGPAHSTSHIGPGHAGSARGSGSRDQSGGSPSSSGGGHGGAGGSGSAASRSSVVRRAAASPAVGYFTPRDGLATGQAVRSGDVLGAIDVLGVAQQVIAPSDGVVGRILATTGEAVEYGQELVRIDGIERLVES